MKCRKYDKECDLWSIGVVTYVLLCGYPPFYGDTDAEIFASVKRGEFDFPSPDWDDISTQAKHFIRACLKVDASKRPTARVSAQTFCCACGAIINDGI
jgi:serine/threonine protein kinase